VTFWIRLAVIVDITAGAAGAALQIVVHYQLPASADTYIHRSGRTGRTGSMDGVVLVSDTALVTLLS
jgi:hypothetical protein